MFNVGLDNNISVSSCLEEAGEAAVELTWREGFLSLEALQRAIRADFSKYIAASDGLAARF